MELPSKFFLESQLLGATSHWSQLAGQLKCSSSANLLLQLEQALQLARQEPVQPSELRSQLGQVTQLFHDGDARWRASLDEQQTRKMDKVGVLLGSSCLAALLESRPEGRCLNVTEEYQKELSELLGQETVVHSATAILTAPGLEMSYPFKRFFIDLEQVRKMFRTLQTFEPIVSDAPGQPANTRWISSFAHKTFPFTFDDQEFVTFVSPDQHYHDMDVIADVFTEDVRLAACRTDASCSPLQLWGQKSHVESMVREVLRRGWSLGPWALREAVYPHSKECTQFKPSLGVAVMKRLAARRVLDISAGWGDRLIAAIACDVDAYVATDPNRALEAGHARIVDTLADADKTDRFQIIYEPFQHTTLPEGKTYDLVFSSPPFFDLEVYTTDSAQSIVEFPSCCEWTVHFLFRSLHKAWQVLDDRGHMAIHISDLFKSKLCEPMLLFCLAFLDGCHFIGVLHSMGASKKRRPIWVWRKCLDRPQTDLADQANQAGASTFYEVWNSLRQAPWLPDAQARVVKAVRPPRGQDKGGQFKRGSPKTGGGAWKRGGGQWRGTSPRDGGWSGASPREGDWRSSPRESWSRGGTPRTATPKTDEDGWQVAGGKGACRTPSDGWYTPGSVRSAPTPTTHGRERFVGDETDK